MQEAAEQLAAAAASQTSGLVEPQAWLGFESGLGLGLGVKRHGAPASLPVLHPSTHRPISLPPRAPAPPRTPASPHPRTPAPRPALLAPPSGR